MAKAGAEDADGAMPTPTGVAVEPEVDRAHGEHEAEVDTATGVAVEPEVDKAHGEHEAEVDAATEVAAATCCQEET
jgi:hypothetical protein